MDRGEIVAFPQDPLQVLVELLINGTWTDISQFVYTRDPITITGGRTNEGQRVDPSRCNLTLNNKDGRFSDRNPMSPYYGLIGRNTKIRVSVPSTSTYLDLPGNDGDHARTPDVAALDITGDLDVGVDITLDGWRGAGATELVGKYVQAGDQRSWRLLVQGGKLLLGWSTNGTLAGFLQRTSTAAADVPASRRLAVRATLDVDNGASGHTVTFYTAPTIAGPWTQLGDPVVTAGTTSIHSGTGPLDVGDISGNVNSLIPRGRVHAAEVRSGIGGTVVANPDFTAQPAGTTMFTDGAGRSWTVEGGCEITDQDRRFVGEVSAWPPRWDVSGKDVWTPIEAAGVLRRIQQGNKPLDSTMARGIPPLGPLAYWPMEEGPDAVQAYSPIAGVAPLKLEGVDWAQADTLASSLPLPVLTNPPGVKMIMSGSVPAPSGTITGWNVRWVYRLDSIPAQRWTFMRILGTGTVREWRISSGAPGTEVIGKDADGTVIVNNLIGTGSDLFNQWVGVSFKLTQNGGNVDWRIDWQDVGGDAGGFGSSYAGTIGRPSGVASPAGGFATELDGMAIGHISVWPTSTVTAYEGAITAYDGDTTANRLTRLNTEESRLDLYVIDGDPDIDSERMGPQRPAALRELLQECADADGGILFEDRAHPALVYRDRTSLYNQLPALTLRYSTSNEVAEPLEPVEDDQRLRNDVTVTRQGGSSGRVVIEEGPLSVLPPEDGGVGIYDETVTLNLEQDSQAVQIAGWRAHLGTWNGARYPSIHVQLHSAPHLIPDVLPLRIGDMGVITGLPAWLPPEDVQFLIEGYTEVLDQYTWDIKFNTSPAGPWRVLELDSAEEARLDTAGSQLSGAVTSTATSLPVLTTEGPVWVDSAAYPSDFPFDLVVGGERVTATACTPGAQDAFGRTVASGWGTADIGGAWTTSGGSASDYAAGSGYGSHTQSTVNVQRRSVLASPGVDFDIYVDITTSATATGGSLAGGPISRSPDVSNFFHARLEFTTANAIILTLRKRIAGSETELDTYTAAFTHTPGTFVRVRFQGTGTALKAKVWLASKGEPGVWQVEATDSDLTAAGSIGVRSFAFPGNTNVSPQVRFDTFRLANPQLMTVTRSVNGITKTHAAGTSVELADPVYIPL